MSVTGTGNAARFAARPLSCGGTSPLAWTAWGRPFPELDLTGGKSLLVVAPHPDDETLGFGAAAATLQSRGVKVQVVSVTDGDASYPGLPMRGRRKLDPSHRTARRDKCSRTTSTDFSRPARWRSPHPPMRIGRITHHTALQSAWHMVCHHQARRRASRP